MPNSQEGNEWSERHRPVGEKKNSREGAGQADGAECLGLGVRGVVINSPSSEGGEGHRTTRTPSGQVNIELPGWRRMTGRASGDWDDAGSQEGSVQ